MNAHNFVGIICHILSVMNTLKSVQILKKFSNIFQNIARQQQQEQ